MNLAQQLLDQVHHMGGAIERIVTERLQVKAPQPLPPSLVQQLRQYKAQIAELLDEPLQERTAIITANGVPEEWAAGFARLCVMAKPAGYSGRRWEQLVNDGGLFLDHFGGQAAALGWRAVDVFGVHPNVPATATHCMGLVPLINGGQVLAITADSARLQTPLGAIQTFQRRLAIPPNAIALWELTAKPTHNPT